MLCPHCRNELIRSSYHRKIVFRCGSCTGQLITVSALRSLCGNRDFANNVWRAANYNSYPGNAFCPDCGKPMQNILLPVEENLHLELDVCKTCQWVWFDTSELETLPLPEPEQQDTLPPKAREILALRTMQQKSSESSSDSIFSAPDQIWKILPALLGLPVESNSSPLNRVPFVTWSISAACILIFAANCTDLENIIPEWGFIPSQWYRYGGATFLSSMFLHGSWGHLIGNMYFFLTFGDNVEDEYGHAKFCFLIFLSGLAATLLHFFFNIGSTIPCVGASGFISGIIACYAVCFPQTRISLCIGRIFLSCGFVSIPAWVAFLIWLIWQIVQSSLSVPGAGGTAYFAHIGGAAAGAAAGIVSRLTAKKQSF